MLSNLLIILLYILAIYIVATNSSNLQKIATEPAPIVFFIIGMLIVFYSLFIGLRNFNKLNKKRSKMPEFANQCPDQWSKINNQCVNDFNIGGKCGSTNFDKYTKKQKCKWSKKCQSPWEGIDDIC